MRRLLVGGVFLAALVLSVIQVNSSPSLKIVSEDDLIECLGYNKDGCQDEWISRKIQEQGPSAAVSLVGGSRSPVVTAACHTLMHKIGIQAHDALPNSDLRELLLMADSDCQFGYQHGVFIAASMDIPDDGVFIEEVYSACSAYDGNEYNRTSCRHGIGHAATLRAKGDVVSASNNLCSKMPSDAAHCVTGAVMEWVSSFAREAATLNPALRDVCSSITEGLQQSCWREIPGLWQMLGESGADSLVRCSKLSQENKEYCSRGVGFRSRNDADCAGPDSTTTGVCMGGRAIIYYETQYKTDPEAATRICPSIAAPEARELCESELQYTIDAYASIE